MTPGSAPGWKEQQLEGAGSPELGQPLRTPAGKVMTGAHLAGLELSRGRGVRLTWFGPGDVRSLAAGVSWGREARWPFLGSFWRTRWELQDLWKEDLMGVRGPAA